MHVHLTGLPHTETVPWWDTCAFTAKVRRLCGMLRSQGHHVTLYAAEGNEADCDELVTVVTAADRRRWFGDETYTQRVFDRWDASDPCWAEMNAVVIDAMRWRVGPRDLIGVTVGSVQRAIPDAFPANLCAEVGVGYEGTLLDRSWACFESYAWMHHVYGQQRIAEGRWFDTVIPNSFDPTDLAFRADKDGYLLYLGRLIPRKGLAVVAELAERHKVITAGQGDERVPGAEHVGVVRGREKAELLAHARAVLVPTSYIEPFGGVAVEAMLSGTPVITTDWGAFSETVVHGLTGYRCRTLAEFTAAAENVEALDPLVIRTWALGRYTTEVCAPQYDAWLRRLHTLHTEGWYAMDMAERPERSR